MMESYRHDFFFYDIFDTNKISFFVQMNSVCLKSLEIGSFLMIFLKKLPDFCEKRTQNCL